MHTTIPFSALTHLFHRLTSQKPAIVVLEHRERAREEEQGEILEAHHGADFLHTMLLDALMWSCPIEILNINMQDTMQLLLMEDQHVIQTLSSHAPQKAFADRIGAFRMIRRCEHLDAVRYCGASETGSKLAIVITEQILQGLHPS